MSDPQNQNDAMEALDLIEDINTLQKDANRDTIIPVVGD
jgi:hypothetical protein